MGEFFEKVRRGSIAGPRKRTFKLKTWEQEFEKNGPHDKVDLSLYVSGHHIHNKLNAIRKALSKSSLSGLSTETRVKAFIAAANHEYEALLINALKATQISRNDGKSDLDAYDLARLQVATADGQSYSIESILATAVDGITIPLRFALISQIKKEFDNLSDVNWQDISRELNLGAMYGQAENIWEDCIWNDYILEEKPQCMVAMPTKLDSKRGAHAAVARKAVLGLEAITHATMAIKELRAKGVSPRLSSVKAVLTNGSEQRIELGTNELDLHRQSMLFALQMMACPPYFESLINEPQQGLGGLSILQLFDGWIIISQAARHLWDSTEKYRSIAQNETSDGTSDMSKYIPHFTKEAILRALQEAINIPPAGAHALIDFLTFSGAGKQQLWTQPLIAIGNEEKLYPIFGAVASPPNLRFVLELWMAQLGVDFGNKGEPFEKHLRQSLIKGIATSPVLSEVAKVVPTDFTFKCQDGSFGQIDALFCVGSQVFVVEAKCILEPTESTSIGTHRQTIEEASQQAKKRVLLINEHREEFMNAMKRFGWNLPKDFYAHPLIAVSTVAHVGVACNGVSVVDELVLERFFAGGFERTGVDSSDFSIIERIHHPFYSNASEAEKSAAMYFAAPPQLQQYLEGLKLRKLPIYPASEEDWFGVMFDFSMA